ncbi:MAG: HipA domain-containing protein [Comamonadaceae bacterium]|nr:HipA domain-containing protein [Comamonadaceae bacterium]
MADWSDHHTLIAMSRRGEDPPGDLIVGEESFARWQALEPVHRTRDDYPALADATIAGRPPGSSAGGERPKFGVRVDGRQVLVKFAARGRTGDPVARRWCDLVILEAQSRSTWLLRAGCLRRARTVLETPSHWFLESERFDRAGVHGRIGVLSLAAVHDDLADSWARAARSLREAGRLSDDDARRLRWLDAFGALIGNTDRHQHNYPVLSGRLDACGWRLPSIRCRCSYAPTADGQVPPRAFAVPTVTSDTLDVWDDARSAAREFWSRGSDDARLSDDVRFACAGNAQLLAP